MARIRSIKPTFWTDEKIGLLPRDVRLTFLGLISAMADDHGRIAGNARIARGAIYPYDDDVSTADVERHLTTLAEAGRIQRYRISGDDYIQITNWSRHQKVDRPSPSLLPPPPEQPDPARVPLVSDSSNAQRTLPTEEEGRGGEGKGEEPSSSSSPAVEFDAIAELLARLPAPSRPAWAAEITAAEQGMHGPPIPRDRIVVACRDYVGNGAGDRPSLRHFRGYLAAAARQKPPPPPNAPPPKQGRSGDPFVDGLEQWQHSTGNADPEDTHAH